MSRFKSVLSLLIHGPSVKDRSLARYLCLVISPVAVVAAGAYLLLHAYAAKWFAKKTTRTCLVDILVSCVALTATVLGAMAILAPFIGAGFSALLAMPMMFVAMMLMIEGERAIKHDEQGVFLQREVSEILTSACLLAKSLASQLGLPSSDTAQWAALDPEQLKALEATLARINNEACIAVAGESTILKVQQWLQEQNRAFELAIAGADSNVLQRQKEQQRELAIEQRIEQLKVPVGAEL